jgi:hypothetical protein
MSLRDAVEATLVGRNPRLVERCNVQGIVDAIEQYGIYDVDELSLALDASFGALQLQVGDAAPPVFLALLKAWLGAGPAAPPSTPAMPMPPSTPSTESPPAFAPEPAAAPTAHPMVVMVKFNGKVIVERSTVQLPPSTTWEQVVRLRLGDLAEQYMDTTLKVALYPTGQQKESERVGAAISDAVGPSFALGYPFAVLSFSAPVYACARPAAKGVDAFAPMMAKARAEAGEGALMLPKPYVPKEEGGKLNFELALFNALREQCERTGLGVKACDVASCQTLLIAVRDALWLMAQRERSFPGQVSLHSACAPLLSHVLLLFSLPRFDQDSALAFAGAALVQGAHQAL